MSTHSLDGRLRIPLSNELTLRPPPTMRGAATIPEAPAGTPVLGSTAAAPTPLIAMDLQDFVAAQPPVELKLEPLMEEMPVLGGAAESTPVEETAVMECSYDPGERAMYAMLHEVHTTNGIIYDVTLPRRSSAEADDPTVLGGVAPPNILEFPIHRLVRGGNISPSPLPEPGEGDSDGPSPVLGGFGEVVTSIVGSEVISHVLQMVKAPVSDSLTGLIASYEGEPYVIEVMSDGTLGEKLSDAAAWRARFDPAQKHRILLIVHGFISDVERSLPATWVRAFGAGYDAILAYNQPTITRSPLRNAADLIDLIPDDVQLKVDIVAHSRGGLVARSLTELQTFTTKLDVERIITCGSPHSGTQLANFDRWDRLISIGFTAASWLTASAGLGIAYTFIPRGLEYVLRAAGQFTFDLPGLQAMNPDSEFLEALNAPSQLRGNLRYAAVTSKFNPWMVQERSFRDALASLALSVFMQAPNDLIVPTMSMSSIDQPGTALVADRVFETNVNHFTYFDNANVQQFAETFLLGGA